MRTIKLLQITDTHIKTRDTAFLPAATAADGLRRAIEHIHLLAERVDGIDAVIHTGDLVDHGDADEYERFNELIAALKLPFYALPGNHDRREGMRAAGLAPEAAPEEGPIRCGLDFGPVRALLLDDVVPGASHGEMGAAQIDWAAAELDAAAQAGRPAIVFTHHPPFPSGVGYMDAIRMRDGETFAAMLAAQPNLTLFACGHHHRAIITRIGAAPAMAAPAVGGVLAVDFRPDAAPIGTEEQSAVTLHVWREEPGPFGTVSSYVSAF
ncbi:MAG: metallophosphoesterase [Neomegalonema sp.]|nr:metallophosphoesterase [Neomegalonema sp.]